MGVLREHLSFCNFAITRKETARNITSSKNMEKRKVEDQRANIAAPAVVIPEAMLPFVRFEFPMAELGNSETDEICRFCGEWCTENSACSNRYFTIQGHWQSTAPNVDTCCIEVSDARAQVAAADEANDEGVAVLPNAWDTVGEDYIEAIPACDDCMAYYDLDGASKINVLGRVFVVNFVDRAND